MTESDSKPRVSIIMAAYNAGQYIGQAISSVLAQDYSNFELLIINDGSTDNTANVIGSFNDERIIFFQQENRGVSAARNVGFAHMKGDYFCFFDSDDEMPPESLRLRVEFLQSNPDIYFLDGIVEVCDSQLNNVVRIHKPAYTGSPLRELVRLNAAVFFGPSWMIRTSPGQKYKMMEGLTHGEDLLFYMELSRSGLLYSHIQHVVLKYRSHPNSAMKNLDGLLKGYKTLYRIICSWPEVSRADTRVFRNRVRKSMFLSYLAVSNYKQAFRTLFFP